MPDRSYYIRQARVCQSLANSSDDAIIRDRYERLALEYLERAMDDADCSEDDFLIFLTSPGLAPGSSTGGSDVSEGT